MDHCRRFKENDSGRGADVTRVDPRPAQSEGTCLGRVGLSDEEAKALTSGALVDRLVAVGISRLSAERMVAIERGTAKVGRARAHPTARH
jgi:hypothetical protein